MAYSSPGWAGNAASSPRTLVPPAIHSLKVPLSFEANQGQVDGRVKYLARGQGYTLFLTPRAAVLGLRSPGAGKPTEWLRLLLQGTGAPVIAGEAQLPGESNYFVGSNPARWRTHVPTFARVRYQQVFPGVDLIYYGRQGRLENDFEVAPGADPGMISWRVEGAKRIRVDSTGNLVIAVGDSGKDEVRLQQPRAYQWDGRRQQEVSVGYRLHGRNVSFALGKYNPHQKLIIDPALTYSTYLGGTGGDVAYGVAVDPAGEAYVTGVTASTDFPTTTAGYQPTYAGTGDVFVTKFNAAGTGVLFSTYLGGTGVDTPSQILLDAAGHVFLAGSTSSTNFPTTTGVLQTTYAGNQDAFLTEMTADGSALVYSTYIGGTGADFGTGLALDSSGDAFVVGSTQSTDLPTKNPLQLGKVGLSDAFVTEVSPTGTLVYSTYLGGSLADYGTGVAVDSSGNVYVCGYTYSTDFPTQSALQSSLAGGSDIFLTEFKPGSNALLFSTYLGGSSLDRAFAIIVDASGNIYLTGDTQSANFPVTATSYQSTLQGTGNAFVTKVAPGGSLLVYSTFFGGSGTDQAAAMALDSANNIYITGFTQSSNFPLLNSFQNILGISGAGTCGSTNLVNVPANQLCADAFVAKFGPSGIPVFSSFLGGNGSDSGEGIAVDSSGTVYVVGGTTSSNFPVTPAAYQWMFQGSTTSGNGFFSKISPQDAASLAMTPQQVNFGNQPINTTSNPVTVTLTNEGSAALGITSIASSGDFQQTNTCGTSMPGGGTTCTIQITFTPTSVGLQTNQVYINDSTGGTHVITVTGNGVLTGGSMLLSPSSLQFPAQMIGTTSPSQSVVLINNGNQAVTITNIVASPGFAETNTCGNFPATPAVLNVGQACTISVNFTPTTTGTTGGSIDILSNAVNTVTSLHVSGTGTPEFTLSSSARSSVVLIGSKTATFTISVAAPSSFLQSIALSCSSAVSCTFSPSTVRAGESSALTVTGLTATTANPLNFTVTGTTSGQTATLALTVFFEDFAVSATPSGTTVVAGNKATYTVTVTPTNGFSEPVLLSCGSLPQETTCLFNPPAMTLTGTSTASSTLTVTTTAQSGMLQRPAPPSLPPGLGRWLLLMALLTLFGGIGMGFSRRGVGILPRLRLLLLFFAIILAALAVGCENYYVNPVNINPVVTGTPSGTFNVVITGTLGNNSGVTRSIAVNLSVQPGS